MRKHVVPTLVMALILITAAQAKVVDLTTVGAYGTANGAWFYQTDPHAAGSGVIWSFVRIQGAGLEQGYNTDYRPLEFDENSSPTFTRSLPLSMVPIVDLGGVWYREFGLDINEPKNEPENLLSLDKVQLFLGSSPAAHDYAGGGLGTKIWDLDLGTDGDSWVKLDFKLSPGSGWADMFMYVPDSLFTGGDYVTLYSMFGAEYSADNGLDARDGYEEWWVRPPQTPVIPELGSVALALMGLAPVALARARRRG